MSDFDKEAEREKLREKYEQDKEERQATQRMSDLLLKGATMTNSHCGTCGDPLFQQDGTTFCPSCHGNPDAVQGTHLEAQSAEGSVDEQTDETSEPERGTDPGQSATPADSAASTADPGNGETPQTGRQNEQPSDASTTDDRRSRVDDSPSSSAAATPTDSQSRDGRPSPPQSQPQTDSAVRDISQQSAGHDRRSADSRAPSSTQPADGDLEAAHASLVQALEKFAAKAAATDDPRYAKECLEAAREASETLETLR